MPARIRRESRRSRSKVIILQSLYPRVLQYGHILRSRFNKRVSYTQVIPCKTEVAGAEVILDVVGAGVVLKIPVVAGLVVEVVGTWGIHDVVGAGVVLKIPVAARDVVEVVGAWAIIDVVGADVVLKIPVVGRDVVEVVGAWAIIYVYPQKRSQLNK